MDTRDPPAGAGGTPAFRSAVKWCPFPSSEISVCLPSPPAAAAQQSPGWQQHLLPQPCLCQSSALGHLCQGRSEQNVAPSRKAQLCRVTRLPTKTWAKPTAAALQTGFMHFSHQICIYQQGRSLWRGHGAFVELHASGLISQTQKCCFW